MGRRLMRLKHNNVNYFWLHFDILRCAAGFFFEAFSKPAHLMKSNIGSNVSYGLIRLSQQQCCSRKTIFHQIFIRCDLHTEFEAANTFGFADIGALRQALQRDIIPIVLRNRCLDVRNDFTFFVFNGRMYSAMEISLFYVVFVWPIIIKKSAGSVFKSTDSVSALIAVLRAYTFGRLPAELFRK